MHKMLQKNLLNALKPHPLHTQTNTHSSHWNSWARNAIPVTQIQWE